MICCITGHRPNRIPDMQLVRKRLENAFIDLNIKHVIQGMAAGVDLNSANVAYELKIPYTCALPWKGHSSRNDNIATYQWVLNHAETIVIVNESLDFPGNFVYQDRNRWMVDHADVVIAVWDKKKSGTYNTIQYARSKNMPIWMIDPRGDVEAYWYA